MSERTPLYPAIPQLSSPNKKSVDFEVPPRCKLVRSPWPLACCCGKCNCSYRTCTPIFIVALVTAFSLIIAAAVIGWEARAMPRVPTPGYPTSGLEYGIHWFTTGNVGMKFDPSGQNPYYNATRKTVLFIHGWAPKSAIQQFRYTFNYHANDPINGPDVNVADSWIQDGWNVGIFYWNQFGDEEFVNDAELKIYTATYPTYGMRWRENNGDYSTQGSPTVSLTETLLSIVKQALANFSGEELRIVGHSLGTQLASRLTRALKQEVLAGTLPARLLPRRLVLLDPYTSTWTGNSYAQLKADNNGLNPAEDMTASVVMLIANDTLPSDTADTVPYPYARDGLVLVEQMDTTDLGMITPDATMNAGMWQYTAFTYFEPRYCSVFSQGGRHDAAFNVYFWSYAIGRPAATADPNMGDIGPGARTTPADVLFAMNLQTQGWRLASGGYTADPVDNVYQLVTFKEIQAAWLSLASLIAIAVVCALALIISLALTLAGSVHLTRTRCLQPQRVLSFRRKNYPTHMGNINV